MDCAIEVKDVSKKYRLYHDRTPTIKEKMLFSNRTRYEDLWVLRGVNLNIGQGQTVGLIGQNGSGKSTLLKLMTRIIYPDQGSIKVRGKISSLLELGAGFHNDFTGLENIYMNAAIFGLTRKEIDRKLQDIINFSELGDFINSPVRTYSSGMYMRLAFSIAINVEPEVLLIDEILAVGDEGFQKKCFNKMKSFKAEGCTIVIVSHDLSSIEKLCDKVVWLHNGHIVAGGPANEVITGYRSQMSIQESDRLREENLRQREVPPAAAEELSPAVKEKRWGSRDIEIMEVLLVDAGGVAKYSFECGEQCIIRMKCRRHRIVDSLVFGIGIFGQDNLCCYGTNTFIDRQPVDITQLGDNIEVKVRIDKLNLVEGEYYLDIAAHDEYGAPYDYQARCLKFTTYSNFKEVGVCRLDHKWEIS